MDPVIYYCARIIPRVISCRASAVKCTCKIGLHMIVLNRPFQVGTPWIGRVMVLYWSTVNTNIFLSLEIGRAHV